MNFYNIDSMRALLSRHGFHFSKRMGQNFLIADWVPREIAAVSGVDETCGVLEIGPGAGTLTVQLSRLAGRVTAVELDRALLPVLSETLAGCGNVEVLCADVMQMDLPALAARHMEGLRPVVCANLPYQITTPVITALLEAGCFSSITIMIQREVALRICAAPGTPDYGAFSVFCQYHARPEHCFDVGPECFFPVPKVTSSVLRLIPHAAPPPEVREKSLFFQVVRAAFAQRRKTLLNSLSAAFGSRLSKEELRQAIDCCGLPAGIRGECLGIPEFAAVSNQIQDRTDGRT